MPLEQHSSVADPGFSPGGGANSQNCYYFSHFCRKLHENERIWTPRGGRASLAPPLGSANAVDKHAPILSFRFTCVEILAGGKIPRQNIGRAVTPHGQCEGVFLFQNLSSNCSRTHPDSQPVSIPS